MINLELDGAFQAIAKTQAKQEDEILGMQNVTAVGVGHKITGGVDTGDPCMCVFVTAKMDEKLMDPAGVIPRKIGRYQTDVIETGEIFAQSDITLRKKVRPLEGGYSVGHPKITAGTAGVCVTDQRPDIGIPRRYYILSNNHVLANSNDAYIGDPIYQPGPIDGGDADCVIGKLARFVPINFKGKCNYVDAALAEGDLCDLDREIYWNGYVDGIVSPAVGLIVKKTGRTTGNTKGKILAINATVNVGYGGGNVAKFCRQFITTDMSAGGDSGSLVLDENNNAVGLLFAGSDEVTICNDIRIVQALLKFRFR